MKLESDKNLDGHSVINTKLITTFQEILKIEPAWNSFVASMPNPLLYSRMLIGFMRLYAKDGWSPLIVTFWENQQIIGIAPLLMKRRFYFKQICSLRGDIYSDFIFQDKHREKCVTLLVDVMFNQLNCDLATVTIDTLSKNLELVQNQCLKNKLVVKKILDLERAVVPIGSSYTHFYDSLRTSSKKSIRRVRRRLDDLGSWNICCSSINEETINQVLKIDQKSWKKAWREKNMLKEDDGLRIILESSLPIRGVAPIYDSKVWFFEINGKAVAYQIVITHKGTAIFLKTSFDDGFRKYSVGKVLINFIIREIFNQQSAEKIDFVTNLPFYQTWKPGCETRTRLVIDKNTLLLQVIRKITRNQTLRKIFQK